MTDSHILFDMDVNGLAKNLGVVENGGANSAEIASSPPPPASASPLLPDNPSISPSCALPSKSTSAVSDPADALGNAESTFKPLPPAAHSISGRTMISPWSETTIEQLISHASNTRKRKWKKKEKHPRYYTPLVALLELKKELKKLQFVEFSALDVIELGCGDGRIGFQCFEGTKSIEFVDLDVHEVTQILKSAKKSEVFRVCKSNYLDFSFVNSRLQSFDICVTNPDFSIVLETAIVSSYMLKPSGYFIILAPTNLLSRSSNISQFFMDSLDLNRVADANLGILKFPTASESIASVDVSWVIFQKASCASPSISEFAMEIKTHDRSNDFFKLLKSCVMIGTTGLQYDLLRWISSLMLFDFFKKNMKRRVGDYWLILFCLQVIWCGECILPEDLWDTFDNSFLCLSDDMNCIPRVPRTSRKTDSKILKEKVFQFRELLNVWEKLSEAKKQRVNNNPKDFVDGATTLKDLGLRLYDLLDASEKKRILLPFGSPEQIPKKRRRSLDTESDDSKTKIIASGSTSSTIPSRRRTFNLFSQESEVMERAFQWFSQNRNQLSQESLKSVYKAISGLDQFKSK